MDITQVSTALRDAGVTVLVDSVNPGIILRLPELDMTVEADNVDGPWIVTKGASQFSRPCNSESELLDWIRKVPKTPGASSGAPGRPTAY